MAPEILSILLFGAVAEAGNLSAAQVVDLDEAGLDAVKERFEVDNAGGRGTEALDDLGADGYGPGRVDWVGGVRGTIEVSDLGDDGCDDTVDGFSDCVWNCVRWRYIRRTMKKNSRTAFFLVAIWSRRTIIEGRITNIISVRPLRIATKYAQDVYYRCFSSGMSRR